MPIYCYSNGDDVIQRQFPMNRHPKTVRHRGRIYRRDLSAERPFVAPHAGWPIECVASGVNPEQAGELRSYLAKKGVPTEVSADGNLIYRDASHRRKALKARGLHDNSSFF